MSMTPKQNALAILEGRQPDRYVDFMHSLVLLRDPVFVADEPAKDGLEHKDTWGVVHISRPDEPGQMPITTPDKVVITDIENWKEQLTIPSLDDLDWSAVEAEAAQVDRNEHFVSFLFGGGLFERSHYLMGFEDALTNYLMYPDEMSDLLRVIADYKIKYLRLMAEHVHPDVVFFHDDWGSKRMMLMSPDLWREMIKPLQKEIVQTAHDCGMMFMHHSDCFCQPIAADMAEIGIDIWQGVIPQNDILEIQKTLDGKMALIGGVDGAAIDVANITEEEIRAEVRRAIDTYCPAGKFYPAIANGMCFREWNNSIYMDELYRYGEIFAKEHPIA